MRERIPDLVKHLNASIAQNPVWKTLAQKTNDVINEVIHDKRYQMERLRESDIIQRGDWMDTPVGRGKVTMVRRRRENIDVFNNKYDFEDSVEIEIPNQGYITLPVRTLQDRELLISGSKLSGFDYFSDYLQDDDYARVMSYVNKYWYKSGGEHFIEFLGYVSRMRFEIEQLWEYEAGDPGEPSDDREPLSAVDEYTLLEPYNPSMQKIWDDPSFDPSVNQVQMSNVYPTSHIALSYDIFDHPSIDTFGIASLFYYLAPIHLVLNRFVGTVYVHDDLYYGSTVQLNTISQHQALWDTIAHIDVYAGTRSRVSMISQFIAKLDFP